jgi:2-polyprenyl-3-methyl-5-hydroxy-6-metoxy-1,4-benzoquinol methylase
MLEKTRKMAVNFQNTVFLESSVVNAVAHRLNWRAEVLIARNPDAIAGKRILDLASHDGRFSYAALACGARHVVGVEGRERHVQSARRNLQVAGCNDDAYEFVAGDLVEFLRGVKSGEFDTIFCFGVFSHLIEQVDVLREIRRIAPGHFILDTFVAKEKRNLLERVRNYRVNSWVDVTQLGKKRRRYGMPRFIRELRAVTTDSAYRTGTLVFLYENAEADGATIRKSGLMAWATPSLVDMLFDYYGFESRMLDWSRQGISDWTDLLDYRKRDRETWIARLPGQLHSSQ